jgi:phosphoserine phosphatase
MPAFWDLIPDDLRAGWHAAVWPLTSLMNGAPPFSLPESVEAHPAYPAYRHLGYQLYRAMLVAPRDISYPWFTQVLLGLTVAQARALSRAALDHALDVPLSEQIVHSPDGSPPVRVRSGLRYRPAMRALIVALRACGFQVWVVSATNRWSIEVAAGELGIPADRVVGMTTTVRDGRITTELVEPAPYFAGKATALKSVVGPDARVVLAAGDSLSDEGLLSLAEAARIVVTPSARELVTRAETGLALGEPWLVQASFGEPCVER